MIQKYYNGKPSYGDDFDYILISRMKLDKETSDNILHDVYSNNYDMALLFGRQGIIAFIYGILIKLSLSVKKGKILPFGTIYSKNAYDYLLSKNIIPDMEKCQPKDCGCEEAYTISCCPGFCPDRGIRG